MSGYRSVLVALLAVSIVFVSACGPSQAPSTGATSAPKASQGTAPAPKADKPAPQAEKPKADKPAAAAEKPKAPAKLATKAKVAIIPIAYMVPIYAARDKGFFAEEGLEVEFENLAGGTAAIPAMEAGQFAFAQSAAVPPLLAREQGLDIKMVVGSTRTGTKPPDDQPLMMRTDDAITNLKQLEGKKVAINTLYNTLWFLLREAMRRAGADPNKLSWVEMPFPNMPDALINKQVDAVISVEPFTTVLLKTGKAKIASNFMSEMLPGLDNAMYIGSGKWIKEHPEETKAFIKGLSKGIDYVNANKQSRDEIIVGFTKLDPNVVKDLLIPPYSSKIGIAKLQSLADLMFKEGQLKKQMNVKDALWEFTPTEP